MIGVYDERLWVWINRHIVWIIRHIMHMFTSYVVFYRWKPGSLMHSHVATTPVLRNPILRQLSTLFSHVYLPAAIPYILSHLSQDFDTIHPSYLEIVDLGYDFIGLDRLHLRGTWTCKLPSIWIRVWPDLPTARAVGLVTKPQQHPEQPRFVVCSAQTLRENSSTGPEPKPYRDW